MFKWISSLFGKRDNFNAFPSNAQVVHDARRREMSVNEITALNLTSFYACVRVIAETMGSLPLPVYSYLDNGGKAKFRKHPVWRLLNSTPDDVIGAGQWREASMGHVLTYGNSYSEIEFLKNGQPYKLHLLPPYKVRPERQPDGSLVYWNDKKAIPSWKMLHFAGLGFDGISGYSPIRLAARAISLGLATEAFGYSWFANGSKGAGILTSPGELSETAIKNLRNGLDEVHGGPENFGKWMILENGMTAENLSTSPEESQFLGTRAFQRSEMAALCRVPPHLIGDLEHATFSNIEQQSLEFVIHCLRPWCVRMENEINRKLLNYGEEDFCQFTIDALLRGDIVSRTAALTQQLMNGAITIDEWRDLENRNPVENPDDHFVPLNLQTLGQARRNAEQLKNLPQPLQQQHSLSNEAKQAYRDVVNDTMGRMLRRESECLKNAAKKPNKFLDEIEKFYSGHRTFVANAMAPSVKAYMLLFGKLKPAMSEELAKDLCDKAKQQLLDLSGTSKAETLADDLDKWLVEWEQQVNQLLNDFMEEHE